MKIEVKYLAGGKYSHSYEEDWKKCPLHCPKCGAANVWHDTGVCDYYQGELFLCAECGAGFYLPVWPEVRDDDQDKQRLAAIRAT